MPKHPCDEDFYSQIKPFENFGDLMNAQHYQSVPKSWWVILTDIQGSTKAIHEGKYKIVNMLGAAGIACLLNLNKQLDLPYVFGGDGVTVLVPNSFVKPALLELEKLKNLALKEFSIVLRVGAVALNSNELLEHSLNVAKYQLSPGNHIAQFRGTALNTAEHLIKSSFKASTRINANGNTDVNLDGLTCRISPIPSKNGQIFSLICKGLGDKKESHLELVLSKIYQTLENNFSNANPVSLDRIKWPWIPSTFKSEIKLRKGNSGYIKTFFAVLFDSFFSNFLLKLNISAFQFAPNKYKTELVSNSDFKKFDETLRMVLDCSESQISIILSFLNEFEKNNKICFGHHCSKEAIMTCMVFSASNNRHTHFIDGAEGGYTFAALKLKEKLQKTSSSLKD